MLRCSGGRRRLCDAECELESGRTCADGGGGGTMEWRGRGEVVGSEHEGMAMQEHQEMDGDAAALQGGLHETDEDEVFMAGRLGNEALSHSCGVATAWAYQAAEETVTRSVGVDEGAKYGYSALDVCYSINQAREIGVQKIDDSPFVQNGYVGIEAQEPLLEEEVRIMKGRMPRALVLFDLLDELTKKEAGNRLDEWKGKRQRFVERRGHGGTQEGGASRCIGVSERGGLDKRRVFQGPLPSPPKIAEEEEGDADGVIVVRQPGLQAYKSQGCGRRRGQG